jgi:hypothetical protein
LLCASNLQNICSAVDTNLDSQSRIGLRGLRHQCREVSNVSNLVGVDRFFQCLLIADVSLDAVNPIFDIDSFCPSIRFLG